MDIFNKTWLCYRPLNGQILKKGEKEMRQTSEEFMNALLSEEVEESTNPSNVNDMIAKMESTISEKIKEVESNVMNKLTENLANVSCETSQEDETEIQLTENETDDETNDENNEE